MDFSKIASENFFKWVHAVKELDVEGILYLYSEEATFLPTISPDFKQGKSGVRSYFKHFFKNASVCKKIQDVVQPLSEEAYLQSGFYDFILDTKDGSLATIRARFTFVWKKEGDGMWRIIHHHSSTLPADDGID